MQKREPQQGVVGQCWRGFPSTTTEAESGASRENTTTVLEQNGAGRARGYPPDTRSGSSSDSPCVLCRPALPHLLIVKRKP